MSKIFCTGLCKLALSTTTSESFVVQTSEQAFQVAQVVVGVLTADEHVVLEDGNSRYTIGQVLHDLLKVTMC